MPSASTASAAVIEFSRMSWLVAGMIPGVERQALKKLAPDEDGLLKLLERWRRKRRRQDTRSPTLPSRLPKGRRLGQVVPSSHRERWRLAQEDDCGLSHLVRDGAVPEGIILRPAH